MIGAIWRGDPGVIILVIVGFLALAGLIAAHIWESRGSIDRGPVIPGRVPAARLAEETAEWDAWVNEDGLDAWLAQMMAAGARSGSASWARDKASGRRPRRPSADRRGARRPRRKGGPDTAIMAAIRPAPEDEEAEARAWWDRSIGRRWGSW